MNGFNTAQPATDVEFQPIPGGDYCLRVSNYKLDQTGDPWRATFELSIVKGAYEGRKVFANYQVNEKGGPFLKKDMRLMGITEDINTENLLAQMTLAAQKSNLYQGHIKPREYNGKTYYNVYLNELWTDTQPEPKGIDTNDEIDF